MNKLLGLVLLLTCMSAWSQSSMRRCTLLPITDSVGGAIGFKVFEEIEQELKRSNWCTYVSNSSMISVFSKYRANLPQYLKTKEVLTTVAGKLQVGSLIRVGLESDIKGLEVQLEIYGENGEDLYFSEKTTQKDDEIASITSTVKSWLDVYAKTIPYDGKINGILGEQITLDVGKGYPIHAGQKFVVKRLVNTKRHPLLKKIVDFDSRILAEGKIASISDNQALGMIKSYRGDEKLQVGDWVRLSEFKQGVINYPTLGEEQNTDAPGNLGILSLALFGSSSSVDTTTQTSGSPRMSGTQVGLDLRAEGWITREYIATFQLRRSLGWLDKDSGQPTKNNLTSSNGSFKLTGGYRYLPLGFFYGPQVDFYGGYAYHGYDLDTSAQDGFGKNSFSGITLGTIGNIPINRDYRIFARGEFMPFPSFNDDDDIFGSTKSVSSLEFELGVKYQYTPRLTLDGSFEGNSRKARFKTGNKGVSYADKLLKLGFSYNF